MKTQLAKKVSRPKSTSSRAPLKKAKTKFKVHDGFYRLVAENLEDYAIFTTDIKGMVSSWNLSAEKLLGYTESEMVGENIYIIFSPKDREQETLKKEFAKVAHAGRAISEGFHYRKDKSAFWASCLIFPFAATEINEEGYTCIIRDLTNQKELEQRKEDFINIASHELKTPMTSIKIFASIIENQAKKAGDDILSEFIAKLNTQIDGLGELVNRLLDVSQLQSGKLELKRRLFNFNDLAEEVIVAMQQYAKDNEIVYVRKESKNLMINGDKELISQILVNLLSNALKYSQAKGKIIFSLKKDKDKIEVCVQDFGIDISVTDHEKIFQRFYRTEAVRRKRISGVGLGLYIVREIVNGHGGKIWVESVKNDGSTFFFTLPIK